MDNIPIRKIRVPKKEAEVTEGFSIRDVRSLLAGKDMIQELHRHDFFLILALEKGNGSHEIDFTPYKVGDGSIFFLRPGQVHKLTLKAESQGYLMQFKTDFYYPHDTLSNELLRTASNKTLCKLDVNQFKRLMSVLTYIHEEYTNKQERYQEIIKANLGIFFIEVVRNRKNLKNNLSHVNPYAQQRLDEFLELVETHISEHKLASYYADRMNLSSFQLNAITKTTLGKTCSELINDYIILESKRHLLSTSNKVNQIAYQLGYEDASYFIRLFKKHTGYSPEDFRLKFK